MSATGNTDPLPLEWKDCKDLFPPVDEIAMALQDEGQKKKRTRKQEKFHGVGMRDKVISC